jgi:hypothetical protein
MDGFDVDFIEILGRGAQFFSGNSLVMFYFVTLVLKYVLMPLRRNGQKILDLVDAVTKALNEGVFGHTEVVDELKTLNAFFRSTEHH